MSLQYEVVALAELQSVARPISQAPSRSDRDSDSDGASGANLNEVITQDSRVCRPGGENLIPI